MADKSQQTEKPTPKRLDKARREGNFPASREMVGSLQFLAFAAMLAGWGAAWITGMRLTMRWLLARAFAPEFGATELTRLLEVVVRHVFIPLLVAGGLLVGVTLAAQLAVTKMGLSLKKIAPDFKRLSPLRKLRELPRQNLPSLLQASIMLPVFGYAVWAIARSSYETFYRLPLGGAEAGAAKVGAAIQQLLWKAAGVFLVFGVVDLVRQRR